MFAKILSTFPLARRLGWHICFKCGEPHENTIAIETEYGITNRKLTRYDQQLYFINHFPNNLLLANIIRNIWIMQGKGYNNQTVLTVVLCFPWPGRCSILFIYLFKNNSFIEFPGVNVPGMTACTDHWRLTRQESSPSHTASPPLFYSCRKLDKSILVDTWISS